MSSQLSDLMIVHAKCNTLCFHSSRFFGHVAVKGFHSRDRDSLTTKVSFSAITWFHALDSAMKPYETNAPKNPTANSSAVRRPSGDVWSRGVTLASASHESWGTFSPCSIRLMLLWSRRPEFDVS